MTAEYDDHRKSWQHFPLRIVEECRIVGGRVRLEDPNVNQARERESQDF